MNIIFPPVDDHYIKAKVSEGYFTNATELVRHAVRRLREEEDKKHARLMAALEEAEDDLREGRFEPYTPELRARMIANARRNVAAGKTPNPDVCD